MAETYSEKIVTFADAIQAFEGWFTGSRSWRNKNPGNLRRSSRATGKDKDGFCIFPNVETGFNALCHQIQIACDGRSTVYKPTDTILQFLEKYAPSSDGNYPEIYAKFTVKKTGFPLSTEMSELLK